MGWLNFFSPSDVAATASDAIDVTIIDRAADDGRMSRRVAEAPPDSTTPSLPHACPRALSIALRCVIEPV